MNLRSFVDKAKELAYLESQNTNLPIKQHIDLAAGKGIELAKKLNANADIVEAGIYLMDCMLGQSSNLGCVEKHVSMSFEKAKEMLEESGLEEGEKKNILQCVLEHHGSDEFFSLESEICCNADCYRFAAVEGFTMAIRYLREMPFDDLIALISKKFAEKRKLITLDICKEELEGQCKTIEEYLKEIIK